MTDLRAALSLAISTLESFKENSSYEDYKEHDGFTDESYQASIDVLADLAAQEEPEQLRHYVLVHEHAHGVSARAIQYTPSDALPFLDIEKAVRAMDINFEPWEGESVRLVRFDGDAEMLQAETAGCANPSDDELNGSNPGGFDDLDVERADRTAADIDGRAGHVGDDGGDAVHYEDAEEPWHCQNCGHDSIEDDFTPTDGNPSPHICPKCGSTEIFPKSNPGTSKPVARTKREKFIRSNRTRSCREATVIQFVADFFASHSGDVDYSALHGDTDGWNGYVAQIAEVGAWLEDVVQESISKGEEVAEWYDILEKSTLALRDEFLTSKEAAPDEQKLKTAFRKAVSEHLER